MTNVPIMFQPLFKYVDFEGRSRRSEFWLWILFRIVLNMAFGTVTGCIVVINLAMLANDPPADVRPFILHNFVGWIIVASIFGLIQVGLLLPTLAVAVRRLHDIDRTGWWIILPNAVALAGTVIFLIVFGAQIFSIVGSGGHLSDEDGIKFVLSIIGSAFLFVWLPTVISALVLLVFLVTEGKRGPNRFGPDPKGEALNDTP